MRRRKVEFILPEFGLMATLACKCCLVLARVLGGTWGGRWETQGHFFYEPLLAGDIPSPSRHLKNYAPHAPLERFVRPNKKRAPPSSSDNL